MSFIQNIFAINHEIIYFIYGLVFFVLGLAISLQSRHSSRLDLARSLTWLAAFGFLHGFHEWGDLFIPIQAQYLAPPIIVFLHYVHLLLLALSFACLFAFGVALLEPIKHNKWLHFGAAALLLGWLVITFYPFRIWFPDFNSWHDAANALARYMIGLPGGLLAAYALREHTFQRIAPYDVPQIVRDLQVAGIAMALYTLAAGLIVPPVPFFPGNWLNTESFTHFLLVPPQLVRAVIGLAMAWTIIRTLEIFDVETTRQIEAMEQQQLLTEERERIARELHDGAIQKVYTAGLLVRSAQNLTAPETPVAGRLATAVGVLDDAIGDLRQNLGQLYASSQSQEPLEQALSKLASDPRFSTLVTVELDLNVPENEFLTPERTTQILAIAHEALSNIVRHANAHHVVISTRCNGDNLEVAIKDDGRGLPEHIIEGRGMRNMRDRAALLHGHLSVTKLEKGMCVTLNIPYKVEK